MFPASTHSGQAVMAFPDVCKTPVPITGPVPIAYPNIGTLSGTKTATKVSNGDEAGALRNHLTVLHNQLMKAPPGDTTQWHRLLDEYVMTTAKVYQSLTGSPASSTTAVFRR